MNLISLPLTEVAPINTIMDPTMDKWWEDIANSVIPPEIAKRMFTALEFRTLGTH